MEDIRQFLPGGPNFEQLSPLAGAVSFVGGIILAIATIVAVLAVFKHILGLAGAAISGNAHKLHDSGKGLGISVLILLALVALWGVLVNLVIGVGTGVS